MNANCITHHVEGSPVQPGQFGRDGLAVYLEYSCGCGQTFPGTPMVGVRIPGFGLEEFWPEELEVLAYVERP